MKKNVLFISLCLLGMVLNSSCEKSTVEEDTNGCAETVSFKATVKPIIESSCVGCHNGSQNPDLRGYEKIKAAAAGVRRTVVAKTMPRNGSLTDVQIKAIDCWVDQGSKNN